MRGQTTLDFVIGVSIFLAAVLFAFGFVPGILQPFDGAEAENPSVADRVADSLSRDVLGSARHPQTLERYCTVAFFENGRSAPEACNYNGTTLAEHLDRPETPQLNVTITGNTDAPLCWTESKASTGSPGLTENCGSNDVVLADGEAPPETGQARFTARRVVALQNQRVTLEVVVW